jgi:hypothetical protein
MRCILTLRGGSRCDCSWRNSPTESKGRYARLISDPAVEVKPVAAEVFDRDTLGVEVYGRVDPVSARRRGVDARDSEVFEPGSLGALRLSAWVPRLCRLVAWIELPCTETAETSPSATVVRTRGRT